MPKANGASQPFDGFEGFTGPHYTQVPDVLFDQLMPDLSDPELRVLLYIVRRTFGFKRDDDRISLSQMVNGITTSDGRVLDRGTGLSKATVARTLKLLKDKGLIKSSRNRSAQKGNEPTTYRLRFKGEAAEQTLVSPVRQAPLSQQRDTPLSQQRDTQDTGIQKTDTSKFRMAHAKKSRDETTETAKPSDPIAPDQSLSEPINGAGEPNDTPGADLAAAAPPEDSTRHSAPLSTETPAVARFTAFREASASRRERGSGRFEPVAAILPTPPLRKPPGSRTDRDLVTAYLKDFRFFLGDEAPLWSSTSRAINIFKTAHIPRERWPDLLIEANRIVKDKTQGIRKKPSPGSNGYAAKNRAPYYFAILEDLCGLREESDSSILGTP